MVLGIIDESVLVPGTERTLQSVAYGFDVAHLNTSAFQIRTVLVYRHAWNGSVCQFFTMLQNGVYLAECESHRFLEMSFFLLVSIGEMVYDVVENDIIFQFDFSLHVQLLVNIRNGEGIEEKDDSITFVEELHILADVLRVVEILACCIVEYKVEGILDTFLGDGVDERNLGLLVGYLGLCRENASLEEDVVEISLVSYLCAVFALISYGGG